MKVHFKKSVCNGAFRALAVFRAFRMTGLEGHFHWIGSNYVVEYRFQHNFSLDCEAQILPTSVIRGLILGWIFLSDYFMVCISCCNHCSAFSGGLTNRWHPEGVLVFIEVFAVKAIAEDIV